MGTFNMLHTLVPCSNCKGRYDAIVQFKFGDTWQFKYNIEDRLRWGGNDIGMVGVSLVKVYGILEGNLQGEDLCPLCGNINLNNEFDIIIEKDCITEILPMFDYADYIDTDGDYKILSI